MSDFPLCGDVPLLPRQPQAAAAAPDPDYALVLRPLPDGVPANQRLKQLLKVALRRFKMRCVGCTDVAPPAVGERPADRPPAGEAAP